MCMCMPSPSGQRRPQTDRTPGPITLFLAGVAFLAVMAFAAIASVWRPRKER